MLILLYLLTRSAAYYSKYVACPHGSRATLTRGALRQTSQEAVTLGVVAVVGVLVADATNFEGPKVPNFIEKPPFLFASEQFVHPIRTKILSEKATYNFEKFGKTYLTLFVQYRSSRKTHPNKRSCVIVLDTPSQQ